MILMMTDDGSENVVVTIVVLLVLVPNVKATWKRSDKTGVVVETIVGWFLTQRTLSSQWWRSIRPSIQVWLWLYHVVDVVVVVLSAAHYFVVVVVVVIAQPAPSSCYGKQSFLQFVSSRVIDCMMLIMML